MKALTALKTNVRFIMFTKTQLSASKRNITLLQDLDQASQFWDILMPIYAQFCYEIKVRI